MLGYQQRVNDAQAAADVEYMAAFEATALEHTVEFVATARRQESVAPHDLQQCQHARVVFARLTGLADFGGVGLIHGRLISSNRALALYTLSKAS